MIQQFDRAVLTQPAQGIEGHELLPGDVGVVVDILADGEAYNLEMFTIGGGGHAVATVAASHVRPISPTDVEHARPDPNVTDGLIGACSTDGAHDTDGLHFHQAFGRVIVTESIRCSPENSILPGDVGTIQSLSNDHQDYCLQVKSLDGRHIALGWAKPSQIRAVTPHDVFHARVMNESPAQVN